jgi:DNA-binding GntR family transcriptional regulator
MSYSSEKAQAYARPRYSQLSDNVAAYVRDLIMSGEVKGGEYLRVERIATDMDVSVTPVREALAALRGEGFVDQEPRKGFLVVPLRETDVQDLFDEQARISGELASRSVKAMDAEAVAGLVELQGRLEQASQGGRVDEVERLNFEFHRLINTASESRKLEWILRTVMRYSPRRRFQSVDGWDNASVKEHHAIIAAFQASDGEGARTAMESHVRHAGDLLVEHLRGRGVFTVD